MKMDTQVIEVLGRNRLVDELLKADLEVALPVRDRGVDVIAYADLGSQVSEFAARPIQMKAASTATFSVDRKYRRIRDLLIAYVWYVQEPERAVTYALTFGEASAVSDAMGWTKTASWRNGLYTTTRPSKKLVSLLKPYQMSPGRWKKRIIAGV
ncbi:MAG: hypothetical protein ABII12_04520 [Planctomycetota bacterium]